MKIQSICFTQSPFYSLDENSINMFHPKYALFPLMQVASKVRFTSSNASFTNLFHAKSVFIPSSNSFFDLFHQKSVFIHSSKSFFDLFHQKSVFIPFSKSFFYLFHQKSVLIPSSKSFFDLFHQKSVFIPSSTSFIDLFHTKPFYFLLCKNYHSFSSCLFYFLDTNSIHLVSSCPFYFLVCKFNQPDSSEFRFISSNASFIRMNPVLFLLMPVSSICFIQIRFYFLKRTRQIIRYRAAYACIFDQSVLSEVRCISWFRFISILDCIQQYNTTVSVAQDFSQPEMNTKLWS